MQRAGYHNIPESENRYSRWDYSVCTENIRKSGGKEGAMETMGRGEDVQICVYKKNFLKADAKHIFTIKFLGAERWLCLFSTFASPPSAPDLP